MQHLRKAFSLLLSFLFLLFLFPITSALAAGAVTVEYAPDVFQQVRSITLDAAGSLYVCDGLNDRIKKYTSTGVIDTSFGTNGIFGFEPPNEFGDVRAICFDGSGNFYVADSNNDRVVKYSSTGVQDTSFDEGNGNGVVDDSFGNVYDVAIGWHSGTEYIYVCDQMNNYVTRYDINNGNKDSGFEIYVPDNHFPSAIAIDQNNNIFVSVCYTTEGNTTQEIRKYDSTGTQDNTFQTASGQVDEPAGLYIDSSDRVYVADRVNDRVIRLKSDGSLDTDFASSGVLGGTEGSAPEQFISPADVTVDETNGYLYVADSANYRVKKYILTNGGSTTTCTLDTSFDGDGIIGGLRGTEPDQMYHPASVTACPDGGYIVCETSGDRIKKYTEEGVLDTSFSGDGIIGMRKELGGTEFDYPGEVAVDSTGYVYVADGDHSGIKKYNSTGVLTNDFGGDGMLTYAGMLKPIGLAVDKDGNIYVGDISADTIFKFDSNGNCLNTIDVTDDPYSIAVDADGTSILVAVTGSATDHVKKFDSSGDLDTSFAGNGILGDDASESDFDNPRGVTVDSEGSVYVSDASQHNVRKHLADGRLDASFDSNGTFSRSRYDNDHFLNAPYGMAVIGNKLFITDKNNCRIVIISNIGLVSSEKKITSFVFESFDPDVTGTINENAHTVTLTVPHDTDVSSLAPTIAVSANASVSPASGAAQNFSSSVDYTVTAEDSSQQVYEVTVEVAPDDDATLSDLTFGGSTVSGFDPGDTEYDVSAEHHATTVTIGATTSDPNASVSGTGTFAFSGDTQTYTVTVTAEDTTTQETYDINVTRAPDDDATLSDLTVGGSTVSGFDPADTQYDVLVDPSTASIIIGATSADPNASVSGEGTFPFNGEAQTYTVTVTAEDGTTQLTYDVNVSRTLRDDATLSDLTFDGSTVSGFSSTDMDYDISVPHDTSSVAIGATTADSNAAAEGIGVFAFNSDAQTYTVTVTAENGIAKKMYDINVTRVPDDDATLSDLTVNGSSVDGFDAADTQYDITVDHDAATVTIGAATTDPNASAAGTGTLPFNGDQQSYTVTVTAEDGTTSKDYVISVTRGQAPPTPTPEPTPEPTSGDEPFDVEGVLLDENGNPLVGWAVTLASTPRTVITDAEGRYVFEDVEAEEHTLTVKDTGGSVVAVFDMTISEGNTFSWSVSGEDIDIDVTSQTTFVDIEIVIDDEGDATVVEVSEKVENPQTGGGIGVWWAAVIVIIIASAVASVRFFRRRKA